jgi:hypothetical protein
MQYCLRPISPNNIRTSIFDNVFHRFKANQLAPAVCDGNSFYYSQLILLICEQMKKKSECTIENAIQVATEHSQKQPRELNDK